MNMITLIRSVTSLPGPFNPAKTNLQDHARLCKNLACKTCLARACDMSLFLHDSCTILHQFLQDLAKNCANLQVIILAASLAKSCTILHDLASSFLLGRELDPSDRLASGGADRVPQRILGCCSSSC